MSQQTRVGRRLLAGVVELIDHDRVEMSRIQLVLQVESSKRPHRGEHVSPRHRPFAADQPLSE